MIPNEIQIPLLRGLCLSYIREIRYIRKNVENQAAAYLKEQAVRHKLRTSRQRLCELYPTFKSIKS